MPEWKTNKQTNKQTTKNKTKTKQKTKKTKTKTKTKTNKQTNKTEREREIVMWMQQSRICIFAVLQERRFYVSNRIFRLLEVQKKRKAE